MLQHERIAGLKRVPIFAKLSDEALERVARSCAWSQHESGEEILSFQDPSTDVLFLLAGRARVVIHSLEGKAVVFVDLKAGTMFGELAAIDRKPRSASVEALEPCTIASLSAGKFESLMLEQPNVAIATLHHLTADVRRLSERVFQFSTLVVQNRVHAESLRLARKQVAGKPRSCFPCALAFGYCRPHQHAQGSGLAGAQPLTTIGLLRREVRPQVHKRSETGKACRRRKRGLADRQLRSGCGDGLWMGRSHPCASPKCRRPEPAGETPSTPNLRSARRHARLHLCEELVAR